MPGSDKEKGRPVARTAPFREATRLTLLAHSAARAALAAALTAIFAFALLLLLLAVAVLLA